MNRRKFVAASSSLASLWIAGCTGDDDSPEPVDSDDAAGDENDPTETGDNGNGSPETDDSSDSKEDSQPEDVEAAVGSLIEGEQIHLVVEDVRHENQLGDLFEPDPGNEFVVVSLAMKNVSDDFLAVSNLLQASVRDAEDYSYSMTFAGTDEPTFNDGQFAPGEVERGSLVFELPEDATGLDLRFDFEASIIGGVDRVNIDLGSEADVHRLEQDLRIDVHDIGQTIEFDGIQIAVDEVRFEEELGRLAQPDSGNEYAVVDISITNESGEEQRISTVLQMLVKDQDGYSYQEDWTASSQLNRSFDETSPLQDGETRRGQVAYEIEQGLSPLYWVFEFDLWVSGDKTFWQIR